MKARWFLAVWLAMSTASAESWQIVYQGEGLAVSIDAGNLNRMGQAVMFRERRVFHPAQIEPTSLRKISEIQYRKLADCSSRQLAVLSQAAFSENSALVGYEAIRTDKARWQPPGTEPDFRALIKVCGAV